MLEEATMQPESTKREAAVQSRRSAATASGPLARPPQPVFAVSDLQVATGESWLSRASSMKIYRRARSPAFIGPSGCGKSTYIRCFNRMNDLIPGAEVRGEILLPRSGPLRA